MKKTFSPMLILLLVFIIMSAVMPVYAVENSSTSQSGSGKVLDNDLSKAVQKESADTLKSEVSRIGGSIVNAVRALFITFFAVAVIFMGLQAAGGGLKDPKKVELIKGGGVSATISAILVYKAEAIVAFVLSLLRVEVTDILK